MSLTYIDKTLLESIKSVVVGNCVEQEDIARWFLQGFVFYETPNYALKQIQGGPCGVLAVIQAELLRFTMDDLDAHRSCIYGYEISQSKLMSYLYEAFWNILERAKSEDYVLWVICYSYISILNFVQVDSASLLNISNCEGLKIHTFTSKADFFQHLNDNSNVTISNCGCFLFVISLVLTRFL